MDAIAQDERLELEWLPSLLLHWCWGRGPSVNALLKPSEEEDDEEDGRGSKQFRQWGKFADREFTPHLQGDFRLKWLFSYSDDSDILSLSFKIFKYISGNCTLSSLFSLCLMFGKLSQLYFPKMFEFLEIYIVYFWHMTNNQTTGTNFTGFPYNNTKGDLPGVLFI